MKITVKQQDLAKGLSVVSHAVSSRSTLPILANIKLEAEHSYLKLSATDLEIGITCKIDAEVFESGVTTVPAKTFSDLVGSFRPVEVELETESDESREIAVKCGGSRATVKVMTAEEYPFIPAATGDAITLDARQLKETIAYVAFSAADDDSRPVLAAVHIETKDEQLVFAAADAFRLAVMSAPSDASLVEPLLIPAKTLEHLAKILPNDGSVQMVVTPSRSQVLFHTETVDMVSRLIEGTFPNFRAIIPSTRTTRAVIETKEFAAAVKTVTPFARDSSNIARIKLTPGDEDGLVTGSLTIEANAEDIGSNVSTISASVDGPEQEIIFNVKYLSDVLGVITTPEVALEVINASRPGAMKPVGGADYTYIIMPLSVNR